MQTRILSRTTLGLPIIAHDFGTENKTSPRVLILGGVHGDEIEGVACSRGLLESFLQNFPYKLQLTLIPEVNPEGVLLKTRGNSNGVDLNRNLPTKDWSPEAKTPRYNPGPKPLSEKENQALLEELKVDTFIECDIEDIPSDVKIYAHCRVLVDKTERIIVGIDNNP